MPPLITVIIPVYNVERYLRRCVDSVTSQTYYNLEIILVDDGSPDGSGIICDSYAASDTRVRVIHKPNGGLSSARNAGLEIMTGNYVMFVDSDDYIAPDCVAFLFDMALRFSAPVSIGNYRVTTDSSCDFSKGGEHLELISGRKAVERQFGKDSVQYVSAWAKLYEKNLFRDIRFPEGHLHEDEGTTYRLLYASERVAVSDRVVYAYYRNPESITRRPKGKNYQDRSALLLKEMEFFRQHGEKSLEARVRNRYSIQAASHYLPKGYYGESRVIAAAARKMYRGVWRVKEIPLLERLKGWMSAYFCSLTAHLMKIRKKSEEGGKL